jgi:hypothetical protein
VHPKQHQVRLGRKRLPARESIERRLREPVDRSRIHSANYNDQVFLVRYIALAMLVVWLGELILVLTDQLTANLIRRVDLIEYLCGGAILISFCVMKIIGPPPRAFAVRVALVSLMLLLTATRFPRPSRVAASVNTALGLVLLVWYARE